ncbi:hypothetical protein [Nocardia sp. NPDC019395]
MTASASPYPRGSGRVYAPQLEIRRPLTFTVTAVTPPRRVQTWYG